MRALLCKELGNADGLVLEETDDPSPGPGQVLLEVKAAAINFPDTLIIQGKYQFKPDLPFSPGGEAAGVVAAVGEGVATCKAGDRVLAMSVHGAFAEKMLVPATAVIPMPDGMDFVTGAGFSVTYGTSYYALKQRAGLAPGERLLVLGAAGGVGLAAVELGKLMGADVIAAASTEDKLDTACAAGAGMRINYSTESLRDSVKTLTEGHGADVIYDPVGGELSEQAFRSSAWGGRHLVIGFAAGEIPSIPLNLTLLKGAQIVGVFWGSWLQREPAESRRNFVELLGMFGEGKLRPLVTSVYAFEDYVNAFACLTERRAKGKVVLKIAVD